MTTASADTRDTQHGTDAARPRPARHDAALRAPRARAGRTAGVTAGASADSWPSRALRRPSPWWDASDSRAPLGYPSEIRFLRGAILDAFASEAQMLEPISRRLAVVAGRRRAERLPEILYEFHGPQGIADMVALELDQDALEARDRLVLQPVTGYSAAICLWALRKHPLETSAIAGRVRMSSGHLGRVVLPGLAEAGWVERQGSMWRATGPVVPLAHWIVAVEAKRSDWRRALDQAAHYRRYANRSIAVLDAAVDLSRAEAHARADGRIGLARISCDGDRLSPVHIPRWQPPFSQAEFFLAGERSWDMIRTGVRSGPTFSVFGRVLSA